jgi:hypothetical protein
VLLTASPVGAQVHWMEAPEFLPPHYGDPEFGDLDGDGDLDLLYPEPLHAYENAGSASLPVWELNNEFVQGLPTAWYMAACLADLDADGDLDFSGGDGQANLYYYENVGTVLVPIWEEHNEMYAYLGQHWGANPELIDLDADGDLDLALASRGTFLASYRNVGTPEVPLWEEDPSLCDGIEMPGGSVDASFADVDLDGDLDLIAGDRDMYWGMVAFENVGTEHEPVWVGNMDLLIGVKTDVIGLGLDLADLNGDGAPDLLSCFLDGGPSFYLNCGPITLVEQSFTWGRIKGLFREQ